MNDVFDNQPSAPEVPKGEQQIEQPAPADLAPADATPPVADTEKHVPLAALEAERSGRRDWKEKALRFEGELKAMRDERTRREQPQDQQPLDPVQVAENRIQTMVLNASEAMARRVHGQDVVDKAFDRFQKAVEKDPTLYQRVMSQPDPWDSVVREAKRMELLEEVGDDPAAYRKKIEAEIRATLTADPTTPARPALPQSLAGARSSAARTAPGFNGPPPLSSLFPN